jgi:hypothetical protein
MSMFSNFVESPVAGDGPRCEPGHDKGHSDYTYHDVSKHIVGS